MIGTAPKMKIDDARTQAAKAIRSIRQASPNSFDTVAAKWRKLHCEANKLRSISEIDRFLRRMSEAWDGRDFASIGRADVANLLDRIEIENGARQATYCLQVFSSLANWYGARDDNYRSPFVKGMRRGYPVKRDRILTDDELRQVWIAGGGQWHLWRADQVGAVDGTTARQACQHEMGRCCRWHLDDRHGSSARKATRAHWCCPRRRLPSSRRSRAAIALCVSGHRHSTRARLRFRLVDDEAGIRPQSSN